MHITKPAASAPLSYRNERISDGEEMLQRLVGAETFIDPGRFRGTCYRAANWRLLGLTTGRGKDSTRKRPKRSIKEVLGYPLTPRFRELLSQ